MSGWGAAAAAAADEPQGVNKPGVTDAPANGPAPNSTSPPAAAPLSQPATGATPPAGGASAKNPAPGQPAPAQPPAAPPPVVLTPAKRGGLAGLVDDMANVLSGKTTPELAKGSDGNVYVKQQTLTRGQQWMKIAANAFKGAAAGLAAGKGAGNQGQALEAGVQASEKAGQQQQQQQKEMSQEARQQNLDNANYQMLQMQKTEQAWKAARLKVEASQHDIEFAQQQEKRLTDAGGTVLGTVEHAGDIAGVLKVNPDLMADMIKRHQIQIVPNVNPDGSMGGMTVIKMPAGFRQQLLPAGAIFHTFDATTGQYVEHKASDPMTAGEQEDYDSKAAADALKFKNDKAEADLKAAQTQEANARAAIAPTEVAKNRAETANAWANAHKNQAEADTAAANNAETQGPLVDEIGQGKMVPGRLSYLMAHNPQLLEAVAAKYPDFDSSKIDAYARTYKDFTSGQVATQLNSGGTVLGHLNELRALNTTASHIPGTPAWTAYKNKVNTVAPELAKFYGDSTIPAIDAIKSTLTANLPGNRDAAIRTQAQSMLDKFTSFRQQWNNAAPSAAYEAQMPGASPEAHAAAASLASAYKIANPLGEMPAQAQTPATATPAGMVTVRLANGQTGQIPQANVQKFQQDNPGASVVQ